jgi:predicted amidophosphoribosyltransferase
MSRLKLPGLPGELLLCRGCLGPIGAGSEAGLCGRCWGGLTPLPGATCPRCALAHDCDSYCPDPIAWDSGAALWDYHGGRPGLGALLVPGIKAGERGWLRALLGRLERAALPDFAATCDRVTCAPASPARLWWRGLDLAESAARALALRLDLPFQRLLSKAWLAPRQARLEASRRRRLPLRAIRARGLPIQGETILLVDDVWTTGRTLLCCAQALREAGAKEVRVLTLFRATTC